jgi:N-acyl-D-amino-acid deacylase
MTFGRYYEDFTVRKERFMAERYDVLILDAKVVDGTGKSAFQGSVGIQGEKIAAVGDVTGDAARVIDGSGLVLCPGFVDPHSHSDRVISRYPLDENAVMQGITTFVGGNCGGTMAPVKDEEGGWRTFGEWLSQVEEVGMAVNYAPLAGHNTIRQAVMGEDFKRKATPAEIEEIKKWVEDEMKSGAVGLSIGLDASMPGHFADVDEEIVPVARIAQAYGGFLHPHTRHHQNQVPVDDPSEFGYGIFHAPPGEAITGRYHGLLEAVEISKKANRIPLHIAHLTPAYIIPQPHPLFLDEAAAKATLIDIIDKPRDEGLEVTFNVIAWGQSIASQAPLMASFFNPNSLLPDWLEALSKEEFAENLKSRAFRDRVMEVVFSGKFKFRMMHPNTDPYWMDCIQIVRCKNKSYVGKTIGEIARQRRPDSIIAAVYEASFDAVFDILVEDPDATCADFIDKREYRVLPIFLRHPAGMPCTDTSALPAEPLQRPGLYQRGTSPTAFGLYPHYLRTFVKEQGVLSLEEAIKKATSVPAQEVLKMMDRGVIKEGAYADLVLFDFDRLREGTDFREPERRPQGIEQVLVNGTVVYEKMAHTGKLPGKVLRRS